MTKVDIAMRIHQETGIPLEESVRVLDWILGLLKTTLQNGESIAIAGFGKFTVRQKHARPGRNPKTGEALTISARRVVSFYPSPLFKGAINSLSTEGRKDAA